MAKNTALPEWSNELTLEFIGVYSKHPVLYDNTHPDHRNRTQLYKAWDRVRKQLSEKVSVEILRRKKESLMATYRAIKHKIEGNEGAGEIYKPTWFAFDAMDTFLDKIISRRKSLKPYMKLDQDDVTLDMKWDSSSDSYILEELKPGMTSISEIYVENEESEDENHEFATSSPPIMPSFKRKVSSISDAGHSEKRRPSDDDDDECGLYGRLLAVKLRAMKYRNRKILMNKIYDIIFQMEMKELDPLTDHIPGSDSME